MLFFGSDFFTGFLVGYEAAAEVDVRVACTVEGAVRTDLANGKRQHVAELDVVARLQLGSASLVDDSLRNIEHPILPWIQGLCGLHDDRALTRLLVRQDDFRVGDLLLPSQHRLGIVMLEVLGVRKAGRHSDALIRFAALEGHTSGDGFGGDRVVKLQQEAWCAGDVGLVKPTRILLHDAELLSRGVRELPGGDRLALQVVQPGAQAEDIAAVEFRSLGGAIQS